MRELVINREENITIPQAFDAVKEFLHENILSGKEKVRVVYLNPVSFIVEEESSGKYIVRKNHEFS